MKKYLGNPTKQDLTEEICQHEGLDAFVDDLATVFCRKHNVIVTGKDTIRLATIHGWHSSYDTAYTNQEDGQADAGKGFIPRPYGRGITAD